MASDGDSESMMPAGSSASNESRRPPRRRPRRPASSLAEKWTTIDDIDVFYRESPEPPDAPVMVHLHGFGLSGRYLLPTAALLSDDFHTFVPDLPGFGRSGKAPDQLDVPDLAHAAARFLDDRGVQSATLVGNSMGCPVILEFAHHYPERLERAILVSPAGGVHNQPLRRAVGQLARDGGREPPRMMRVATPDYLRFGVPSTFKMFHALTQYPSLERLLDLRIPTLVVIGDRDPLMPGPARVQEVAGRTDNHVLVVMIEGAAHAINFSHPGELSHLIRLFMGDRPIVDDPDSPGHSRVYEIHRGTHHPPAKPR
jgi:pimeloyl-ACP methyl ester carboxylesterase